MSIDKIGYRGKFVAIKSAKKRKISSRQWLMRQLNDHYVARARTAGYRSRAAYKLLEINDKFKLLHPGMKIVDLGAAPGGWSQVAAKLIEADRLDSKNSMIIAVDLLEMEPIAGVQFLPKDFYAEETQQAIMEILNNNLADCGLESSKVDMVMSDMAANTIGHAATDHIRTLTLCEEAFEFALKILKPNGHFIAKIFRGGTENKLLSKVKLNFQIVKHFKPAASRKESTEAYLIALNRKILP